MDISGYGWTLGGQGGQKYKFFLRLKSDFYKRGLYCNKCLKKNYCDKLAHLFG